MAFLNRLKIKTKLAVLLVLAATALAAAILLAASILYQRMMDDRFAKLRSMLDVATGIAQALADEEAAHKITHDEALARLISIDRAMWYDNRVGYVAIGQANGLWLENPANPKINGTSGTRLPSGRTILDDAISVVQATGEGMYSYDYPKPGEKQPLKKISYIKKFAPWNLIFVTGVWVDDIEADYRAVLVKLGLIGVGIMLAMAAAAYVINRNIGGSLGSLKGKMEKIAAGDLAVAVDETARQDEIGDMAKAVLVFQENAEAMHRLQAEQEEVKRKAEKEKRQALADLATDFERQVRGIVETVSSAATQLQSTARAMSSAADGTRAQTLAVASGADQATANVQTVAAASEELAASIVEIGRQVTEAAAVAKRAAEEGQHTNTAVSGLAEAAQKIGEVVALINDIASQTNLLALNATIEAARAGEAGKGFAVVASEVKALANQTAKATDEIRAQIGTIQAETGAAVTAIQGISKTILEVNEISTSIASAVEEQSAATQEITRNVQQAASGTRNVSENITGVSAAVDEAGSAAGQVLSAADALAQQAQMLRREVDRFLTTVRAA